MSTPFPGPVGPPPGNPKFNVLLVYGVMAMGLGLAVLFAFDGWVKIAALPLFVLSGWVLAKAIKAGRESLSEGSTNDSEPGS